MSATTLPLTDIHLDPALQPRVNGLDDSHVQTLMDAPDAWPPLVIIPHDGRNVLADGFHRYEAARRLGLDAVPVEVMPAPPDSDLAALAFDLNARHGRPLSLADRKAFATHALAGNPALSDREIGRRCGLSDKTIAGVRREMEADAEIPQSPARIGGDGRAYTYQAPTRQPGEMPAEGIREKARRVFSGNREQRALASYISRLLVPLTELDTLPWEYPADIADACRAVWNDSEIQERATMLADVADTLRAVARELDYRREGDGT